MTSIASKAKDAAKTAADKPMTPAAWAEANPEQAERLAREVLRAGEAALVPYMLRSLAEADGFPAPHSTVILDLEAAIREQMKYDAADPVATAPDGTSMRVSQWRARGEDPDGWPPADAAYGRPLLPPAEPEDPERFDGQS